MFNRNFTRSAHVARLGLAAAGLIFVTAAGAAGPVPVHAPAITVRYSDLDISTAEGADALYRRIAIAAAKVCPNVDPADLERYAKIRQCRQLAIDRAVEAVHSPLLAAASAARHHHA